jgi:hypothetical protein
MWKEVIVAYVKELSRHVPGGAEEKRRPDSGYPVSRMTFESGTS